MKLIPAAFANCHSRPVHMSTSFRH